MSEKNQNDWKQIVPKDGERGRFHGDAPEIQLSAKAKEMINSQPSLEIPGKNQETNAYNSVNLGENMYPPLPPKQGSGPVSVLKQTMPETQGQTFAASEEITSEKLMENVRKSFANTQAAENVPTGNSFAQQVAEPANVKETQAGQNQPLKATHAINNQQANIGNIQPQNTGSVYQNWEANKQAANKLGTPPQLGRELQAQQWAPKLGKGNVSEVDAANWNKQKTRQTGVLVSILLALGLILSLALAISGIRMGGQFFSAWPPKTGIPKEPMISLNHAPAEEGLATPDIVNKVGPSVVSIDVYKNDTLYIEGSGSGIILSEDGYIVTNAHVIEGASAIRAVLSNGKGYTAVLIGMDLYSDLAIIKIKAEGLTPAEFGNSEEVIIGERVIAVGNAAGILAGSPTQGIISGANREIQMAVSDGGTSNMILLQTDAAINPGNSGGALVNAHGQVIGINVAKLNSEAIDNIGFAIPVNRAQPVIDILMKKGEIPLSPRLGVSVYSLNETSGPANNLPEYGLYLAFIDEKSPFAELGVSVGDVLLEADGQTLRKTTDLTSLLALHTAKDTLEMKVYIAKTKETETLKVDLLEAKV